MSGTEPLFIGRALRLTALGVAATAALAATFIAAAWLTVVAWDRMT